MYIEIDISDRCIDDSDHGYWRGASTLVSEGDSLDELLDNATIYWSDQDGGEAGESEGDDDWCAELIQTEYYKKIAKDICKQCR